MRGARLQGRAVHAGLLLLLLCALAARVVPAWDFVFHAPGDVRLFGVDPYFHLRHSEFAAEHFPHLQRTDIGTFYPGARQQHVPGLLDLAIGGTALVIGLGDPGPLTLIRVAAWTPVLLCLAVFWALFLLGRALMGPRAALLACALLLLYPGPFRDRSMLGFPDHHVAEVLLTVLTVLGLVRLVQSAEGGAPAPPWWRPAWLHALPLALFAFTWHGAPLHFIAAGTTLFVYFASRIVAAGERKRALEIAAVRYGLALFVLVSMGLLWPDLVMFPEVYPLILASCALLAVAFPLYGRLASWARARRVPAPAITWLPLIAIPLILWAVVDALPQGWQPERVFGAKKDLVGEHEEVDLPQAAAFFGLAGLLALPAIGLGILAVLAGRPRGGSWRGLRTESLLPLFYAGQWTAMWTGSNDYGYTLAPFVALAATMPVVALAHGTSLRQSAARLALAGGMTAALLAGVLLPIRRVRPLIMPWPPKAELDAFMLTHDGWVQALEWMRTQTPQPSLPPTGWSGPWVKRPQGFTYPAGTYGVMSAWDYGNHIAALAKRSVVNSQGISTRDTWLFIEDVEHSESRLDFACEPTERIRYVVLDSQTLGNLSASKIVASRFSSEEFQQLLRKYTFRGYELDLYTYGDRFLRSIASRLYLGDAQELGRYRLVYETPHQSYLAYRLRLNRAQGGVTTQFKRETIEIDSPEQAAQYAELAAIPVVESDDGLYYEGQVLSSVKVFEYVRGATLTGTAAPGQIVRARIRLRIEPTQRVLEYRRTLSAGPDGRFAITVPHSTERSPRWSAVAAETPCRVYVRAGESFTQVAELEISEAEVQSGSVIELPPSAGE